MSTTTISTFFAVGAIALAALVVGAALLLALAPLSARISGWRDVMAASFGDRTLWLAWVMAVVATLGSLYYSEIADFVPCKFCWYQRIAMYPLAVILGVAAFGRDRRAARYVLPLASAGAVIASYHYLIQQVPSLSTGACSTTVPCSAPWVWKFDFVSIPFMALVSFATIIVVLLIDRAARGVSASHESRTPITSPESQPRNPT